MNDYMNKIDKSRFTDTTNIVLCGDSNNGDSLICLDLVYDSSEERHPIECDVINIYEEIFSDETQKFAEELQNLISLHFCIPKVIA